jgi:hypothetical protein
MVLFTCGQFRLATVEVDTPCKPTKIVTVDVGMSRVEIAVDCVVRLVEPVYIGEHSAKYAVFTLGRSAPRSAGVRARRRIRAPLPVRSRRRREAARYLCGRGRRVRVGPGPDSGDPPPPVMLQSDADAEYEDARNSISTRASSRPHRCLYRILQRPTTIVIVEVVPTFRSDSRRTELS